MWIDNALGIHADALKIREKRAAVIASNLANHDTPNYKAKDIDFEAALNSIQDGRVQFKKTNAAHFEPSEDALSVYTTERAGAAENVDGNSVETHVEEAAYAENSMRYLSSLQFVQNKFRSLMTAIKGE